MISLNSILILGFHGGDANSMGLLAPSPWPLSRKEFPLLPSFSITITLFLHRPNSGILLDLTIFHDSLSSQGASTLIPH